MSQELKHRIVFGLIYAGSIIGLLFCGPWGAYILMIILGVLVSWEFFSVPFLAREIQSDRRVMNMALLALFIFIVIFLGITFNLAVPLAFLSVLYCLMNIISLFIHKRGLIQQGSTLLHACIYIGLPLAVAFILNTMDPYFHWHLLYIFIIVWLCDVGAYFIGKYFGKRKLHPVISPNKTWEGFFGGMVLGTVSAVLINHFTDMYSIPVWIVLGLLVCVTSVLGDLVESSFKRHFKVKDTGTIIPGHGGFLDRLDSFIFALPFYVIFILIFAL